MVEWRDMEKESITYFTTGEFAKLCNVTKHTLFHYDETGVFTPAIKGENGYRYYSIAQIEVFNVIAALKELDMPLSKIKSYIDKRSPEEFLNLLKEEEVLLDLKIKQLKQMKQLLKQKSELLCNTLKTDLGQIYMDKVGTQHLIVTKVKSFLNDKNVAMSIAEHMKYIEQLNIFSPYSIGAMIECDKIKNKNYIDYSCFYTQLVKPVKVDTAFVKEEGIYLTAYHVGGYDTAYKAYDRMMEYANQNEIKIGEYFFEDVLLDDLAVVGYENYVLKISVRCN